MAARSADNAPSSSLFEKSITAVSEWSAGPTGVPQRQDQTPGLGRGGGPTMPHVTPRVNLFQNSSAGPPAAGPEHSAARASLAGSLTILSESERNQQPASGRS